MATTKTLTPTNQAITLAAFTEKPDNRTNVTNDDKLADAVNALNSKIRTISTGSLHDITTPGMYWLISGVADKPEPGAGMYILQAYADSYRAGLYVVADNCVQYNVALVNGTWTYNKLALNDTLINKVKAGTTEANVISFSTTVSFTSGVGYADASSVLPSGYRISIPVAAAVASGSLAVTGCMKDESSNNRIRIQLSNASYSADAAFNIIATIVRI